MTIEAAKRGFAFATVRPRATRDVENRRVNLVFSDRGGATRLHRANQCARQYAYPRLRDPARVRLVGGRRLQSRTRQSGRATPEESRLFQEREDHRPSRARRPIASFSMSTLRKHRPANSRSPAVTRRRTAFLGEVSIAERNLLGRGFYGKARADIRPIYARLPSCRSSIPTSSATGSRSASICSPRSRSRPTTCPTRPRRSAPGRRLGFALREDLGLQVRYSLYQQKITLPSQLTNCNNINPDFLTTFPTAGAVGTTPALTPPPDCRHPELLFRRRGVAGGETRARTGPRHHLAGRLHAFATTRSTTTRIRPRALLADFRQDFAGVGGDVNFIRTASDVYGYHEVVPDVVGLLHLQGGHITGWGSQGLAHAGPFPDGPEPGARICARRASDRAI